MMTDKELKSLSKIQMLELLRQQEEELELLTREAGKPAETSDSELLNEILQSAQKAADTYLKNIQNRENDKIDGIARLENDARGRYEEAERYYGEVTARIKEAIDEINNVFVGLKELIESMHMDFQKRLSESGLKSIIPTESSDIEDYGTGI